MCGVSSRARLRVRLMLVSLSPRRRSGAWKQRVVEAKAGTGLQQQRHAKRSEGGTRGGCLSDHRRLSTPRPSVSLHARTASAFLALQRNFPLALRRKKGRKEKKRQTEASILYILAATAALVSPLKSPRRSVSRRSESVWLSEHFPSSGC